MSSAPALSPDNREVKQKITKKLSSSLRALQIRYVTTDDVVTSDDDDANGLCVALEAVLVHGLKAKFIKMQTERRRRNKGRSVSLPQPAFWALLKAITHRNVISQLENISYISTDVGRCRSWLRLALNECLMECYFLTLQREKSRLMEFYQPFALMLDMEDCDVVLSYLQGLSSLSFDLSYKSSILNEWTVSPLSLAGLWLDESEQVIPCGPHRRKSLDSVSQSSSSDDANNPMINGSQRKADSSALSLDTGSSSSQLSSSLGSDEQSRGATAPILAQNSTFSSIVTDEADTDEQMSKSPAEDMDTGISSSSDTTAPSSPPSPLALDTPSSDFAAPTETSSSDSPVLEGHATDTKDSNHVACYLAEDTRDTQALSSQKVISQALPSQTVKSQAIPSQSRSQADPESRRDATLFLESSAELTKSRSWISEEDFTQVDRVIPVEEAQPGPILPAQSVESAPLESNGQNQSGQAFRVVHRRQMGLSNPFRGLLMLGALERKNTLGLYKPYYCELTPYEFRLQPDGDEQSCAETCSLLRCESVGPAHTDGRFDLQFHNKRLYMRAASKNEAQDWVDRITEAIQKFRPNKDDAWEILNVPNSPQRSLDLKSNSPHKDSQSPIESYLPSEVFDWGCPLEVEPDALKESVLYMRIHKKWTRFVFSLSDRALKCFLPRDTEKSLYCVYNIETMKDILPDSSLGSPSCFRLVTTKGSLQLQAENGQEAKAWRELVRAAYLESEDDPTFLPTVGNYQIKSHIKEHALFQYLIHIPTESGLDTQNFKCAGCHKQIGFQFGKAKLCAYSALYYCDLCHQDEKSVIPSRFVHNWDMVDRAVSRQAINFLKMVHNEPIFNLKYLNESLYQHTKTMCDIERNREKLRLLGEYLMTCRSGAVKELSASLDQRNYLLDCAHTYSLQDLKQISDGMFEPFLQSAVEFACSHVFQCDLCSQRGFICQICNSNEIIYPFQFDTTCRCPECKAVFHIPCKAQQTQCPRCLRRRRYQDQGVKV
ncbi:pleckstrin homology domain-containing family M member 1 isoform X3 [Rana temporaria]|uniref:pleckstrin homology domain-containing family M member 1 isoform X3 n=1 Tax=Rana temporaria TaxID=8407 RepID=UPI001AAD42F4|nr:pleckstrin homology domain-containing family M member 1 isoform X3 [Rana temporaria]